MRNVLEEFRKPRRGQRKPTILGLREHIFTGRSAFSHIYSQYIWPSWLLGLGFRIIFSAYFHCYNPIYYVQPLIYSVSSLAWFMSNQETSFVTIGQRVLANPLRYALYFRVTSIIFFLCHFPPVYTITVQVPIHLITFYHDRVRFHYGHPDIFDRLFHITRGGISKASKVINLSEDIFSGKFFIHQEIPV